MAAVPTALYVPLCGSAEDGSLIPTDRGFDPVQAAYNLTRKNPSIDWEIDMLGHLKNGNFEAAHRCGIRAAEINLELARAPEVDAKGATEHLIKAALLFEQVKEFARAADVYGEAVARDPSPGTRLIEGRRTTSPLRAFDLEALAGRQARGRETLGRAEAAAKARLEKARTDGRHGEALDDAEFLAELRTRLKDTEGAAGWRRVAVGEAMAEGERARRLVEDRKADPYELSRTAFERALSQSLDLQDDALFLEAFGRWASCEADVARLLVAPNEKWEAFRPMECMMEAGVHLTVAGDFKGAREMFELAKPLIMEHWKEQRGPTYYKLRAHLAILAGHRAEAESWRSAYREEFERKERFDPEVAKPIQLEFDEEFYRMLGDEAEYRKTLITIVRTLEPGMREIFEGVDKLLEGDLYKEARKPLDELGVEAQDQRIWRLLSAYVSWRAKVAEGEAKEGDAKAFEDHMWHEIHPFKVPRQGLKWSAVLEVLGAEEDPIDLYPLPRMLALIHGRAPASFAIWIAAVDTPPEAPVPRTHSLGCSPPRTTTALQAVW